MGLKNLADEYSKLMGRNPEGTYLYTPQKFEAFHPGSLGYFDENGTWNMITDLCLPERTQTDGFKDMSHPLKWEKPETAAWRTRSSDGETEQSLDANAEISGALSSAPVDVGGKAKTKRGSTMKAELVTGSVVKHERLKAPFNSIIQSWIKNNAKELVQGIHGVDVRKYGVWAIRAVYVTPECAITMDSGKNSEISLGATVGATGIGKLGTEGSTLAKFKNAGWTTYSEEESEQGYVVAFSGSKFALRPFSALRSNPLHQIISLPGEHGIKTRPLLDEDGNVVGSERVRIILDEAGHPIGEEKIDEEAERKAQEEKFEKDQEEAERQELEDYNYNEFDIECDPLGTSEQDLEEEKQAEKLAKEAEIADFKKHWEEIKLIPDEKEREMKLGYYKAAFGKYVEQMRDQINSHPDEAKRGEQMATFKEDVKARMEIMLQ
ncbi:hypothetical protein PENARI_c005G00614 [Penicillium arizonense]|uniref:Uncharacterized protein n=1 Tax=Penicillium arizonense TaxID=1835702 RepID=A0A1F5LP26_PENAI|nr:hypothetical protein PENARI_c005G00614 [Penicillium arizonense]OGE54780.1 hypothetical protein PENARI_c005G00614 [Penicillium arizonense]